MERALWAATVRTPRVCRTWWGNVWEWTSDCWEGACVRRVYRGGSWLNFAELLRPGARFGDSSAYRDNYQGFRVSRTLD